LSLRNNRGYARQRTTAELIAEIERLTGNGTGRAHETEHRLSAVCRG
jgi:hypothetical protein